MVAQPGKTLNDRALNSLIHPFRYLDNVTNLWYLGREYASLALVVIPTIYVCENLENWGLSWAWAVPVVALAVALIGAIQHRLAGLGHEGAHYILFKNRVWNELASDLLCMFPLFATTEQYRLIHLGHHEYTNDWERDPELLNLGKTRMMDRFPMSRKEFIYNFYIRILWPVAFLRYMWDNIYVTAMGQGINPYVDDDPATRGKFRMRLTTFLGIVYLATMFSAVGALAITWSPAWTIPAASAALYALALATIMALPESWFFKSKLRPVYSPKVTSALRLGYYTVLNGLGCYAVNVTQHVWGVYVWLLWVLPQFTTFPYYMLIRDLFQHANADDGKLTNSRVVFCDPFTMWAVFVYGQDAHLTHHLYPAVPHYQLSRLHALLKEKNAEYAEHVMECHGVFKGDGEHPTLLDAIEAPHPNIASALPKPKFLEGRRPKASGGTMAAQTDNAR